MPKRRTPGQSRRPAAGSGGGWDWERVPPSKPIRVEGGLAARSKRGQIGDTWWSRRFLEVLESFGLGSRLQRGKNYARAGQVLSMEIVPGQVRASVQGSRAKPYRVFLETEVLSEDEWHGVEAVMASSAVFLATLLSGEMPEEIEAAFVEASVTLFPRSTHDLVSACSCPDWENPCKHIAAVYYLLAEAFDRDPFLMLAWRGRDKVELLDALRVLRRGRGSAGAAGGETGGRPAGDTAERETGAFEAIAFGWPVAPVGQRDDEAPGRTAPRSFWGDEEDLAAIVVRPRLAVAADLALRQLDPALLGEHVAIVESLRTMYEAFTAGALALALDGASDDDLAAVERGGPSRSG